MSDVLMVWGGMFLFAALAVGAILGIQRRSGRARLWYVAGLVLGAGIGLAVAWPADDTLPAPWGMMIGVAAAGLAPAVMRTARATLPLIGKALARRVGRGREDEG